MKHPPAHELVRILMEDQQTDGSFLSYSVPLGSTFGADAKVYRTTFAPALIVGALASVPGREAERVRERAADWLLAQRGPQWSFNYWARAAAEAKSQPYPDDWDDTSCAVAALTLVRPEVVTGEVLGHLVTLLTNTEMEEGGPYRTWIVGADAHEHWHDVDVAVNANIAYMLALHGVDLPSLEGLADERIAKGDVSSPYYPGPGPIEYFLSRWYRGEQREKLLKGVLARRKGGRWGNALDTAMAVSAVLNLGVEPRVVKEAVEWLRGLREGDVVAEAFSMDPASDGVKYVAGSRALTAAYVLEAIANYDEAARAAGDKELTARAEAAPSEPADRQREQIHKQVVAGAMARLEAGGAEIRTAAHHLRGRLMNGAAGGQITLLPYLFRRALGERGRDIGDERLVTMGMISLYGWLAYTVYDDFLDDEGEPTLLPAANMAMRELVLALQAEAVRTPGFGSVAWPTLDRQEAANAWEVSRCRVRRQGDLVRVPAPEFGDLHVLAERSMGHALGCVAITMELGYAADSPEVRAIQRFFHHFLIARQLGDDAHDWKADLQKGQINAVGAYLLNGLERRGRSARALYGQLEQQFWEQGVHEINEWIFRELAEARAAIQQAALVQQPEVLEVLLAPIEEAAHKAGDQQRQTVEFLRSYRPPAD